MKRFFALTIILSSVSLYTQITTTKVQEPKTEIDNTPYDSLSNHVGLQVQKLVGQELYTNKKVDVYTNYDAPYKGNNPKYYGNVIGKYLKVISFKDDPSGDKGKYILKLSIKGENKTLYYPYDGNKSFRFKFLVAGYFVKMNNIYTGQKLILKPKLFSKYTKDPNTGLVVTYDSTDIWTVKSVTLKEESNSIDVLVGNGKGDTILLWLSKLKKMNGIYSSIFSLEKSKELSSKFGSENWNNILKGTVSIGFTEEMCRMSWGKPNDINPSSYGTDQWVYKSGYLYFENGKLTSWN